MRRFLRHAFSVASLALLGLMLHLALRSYRVHQHLGLSIHDVRYTFTWTTANSP